MRRMYYGYSNPYDEPKRKNEGPEPFDLIEWQNKAKDLSGNAKALFELWEEVCRRYDRNEIGKYEMEEMRDLILPDLQATASIKRLLEGTKDAE